MSIIHFTTVHPRTDTRIRIKQAASLAQSFNDTIILYVQDGKGDAFDHSVNVQVIDTGCSGGRMKRMTKGAWRMYLAVRQAKPRVAHFHDPELIPVGFLLKLSGIKVIYDVHEDLPRQILGKHWLPVIFRPPIALIVGALEWFAGYIFDGIVAATSTINRRFPKHKTVTVQNFPILDELATPEILPYVQRPPYFSYIGGITSTRGAHEMVHALEKIPNKDVRLQLAGVFQPTRYQAQIECLMGWPKVIFHGWVGREDIGMILGNVRAGLVVLHPTSNYPDALPVKLFEYMAAGLPVIASDFPLWREIVNGADCGLLVNPLDPESIAEAMIWLLENPEEAEAMGNRGRRAVKKSYNWKIEAEKLVNFYDDVIGLNVGPRNV